jgi:hypothetical protein
MTTHLSVFAAVFAALYAAHQVADHWVQTDRQTAHKGLPSWDGRRACAQHVATYMVTALVALAALAAETGWRPQVWPLLAGLTVSAVTHYIVDRRAPLVRLAGALGLVGFLQLGRPRPGRDDNACLGTGAYALDQSWHIGWLFVAALLIAI